MRCKSGHSASRLFLRVSIELYFEEISGGGEEKKCTALAKEVEENLWENEALDSGKHIFEFIFGFHS